MIQRTAVYLPCIDHIICFAFSNAQSTMHIVILMLTMTGYTAIGNAQFWYKYQWENGDSTVKKI